MNSFLSAYQFNQSMEPIIESFCLLLLENFGITHFGHIKINEKKRMLRVANCEKWNQIFFQEKFYNDFEMYNMASIPHKGIYRQILTGMPLTKHEKILYENDLWNALLLYERLGNEGNFTFFCTTRDNTKALNYYLNYPTIFDHFVCYFKEKISSFLDFDKDKCISLNFNPFEIIHSNEKALINEKIMNDFFQKTRVSKFNLGGDSRNISFSKRQAECLYHLIHGQTVKETARTLNLSPRTVEKILIDIKKKTGISSKSMLVQKLFHIADHLL